MMRNFLSITLLVLMLTFMHTVLHGQSITSVSPGQGTQGTQNLQVQIQGNNTQFQSGTTLFELKNDIGYNLTINNINLISQTSANIWVSIDNNAPLGYYDLEYYNTVNGVVDVKNNAFKVLANPNPPQITQLNPNRGEQGQQNLSVGIRGSNTNFQSGTVTFQLTHESTNNALTITNKNIINNTLARIRLNIGPNEKTGHYDLSYYNNIDGNVTKDKAFFVDWPTSVESSTQELPVHLAITSLSPESNEFLGKITGRMSRNYPGGLTFRLFNTNGQKLLQKEVHTDKFRFQIPELASDQYLIYTLRTSQGKLIGNGRFTTF